MDEAFVEAVLIAVEQVPSGQVTTYGDLAELVGRGGPRQVGRVMSLHGGAVCWWRVVRADGRPASCHDQEALGLLKGEGTPLWNGRVRLALARWSGPGA